MRGATAGICGTTHKTVKRILIGLGLIERSWPYALRGPDARRGDSSCQSGRPSAGKGQHLCQV